MRLEKIAELQRAIHATVGPLLDERPIALVDFPDIRNCGDSAIWLGEMAYLANEHRKRPAYVSRMLDFSPEALSKRVPDGPILIHGWGNFGDIWVAHQDFREHVLEKFPDRDVIQMPQSIHFSSQTRLEEAARKIARHKRFTLLVRDVESFDLARKHFDCRVQLCPDMAFAIGPLERRAPVSIPVLAMLRADAEAAGLSTADVADLPVEDWIDEDANKVRMAKVGGRISAIVSGNPSELALRKLDAAAHQRFDRGVRQLSRAQAIVTDRLHVHIVSLLLGIPHAVLDNSYGKVRRFMSAFSGGTELSHLPDSMADAVAWAKGQNSVMGAAA